MAGKSTQAAGKGTQHETAQEAEGQLKFDVRIHAIRPADPARPQDSIRATASININSAFAIRGVKVIEGTNGLFVSMPSYRSGNEYRDICFPITAECRNSLNEAVLSAYSQAIMQGQSSVQGQQTVKEQAPEGQAMEMAGM